MMKFSVNRVTRGPLAVMLVSLLMAAACGQSPTPQMTPTQPVQTTPAVGQQEPIVLPKLAPISPTNASQVAELARTPGKKAVLKLAISPDGKLLATGSADKTVRLWNVKDGSLLKTLEGHSKAVRDAAFSPDGRLLATASGDVTVVLWGAAEEGR